jgi:arginase
VLGLRPSAVEELPAALLGHPRAVWAAVEAAAYDPRRDAGTEILNLGGIAGYSVALADAVGGVLGRRGVPRRPRR